MTDPTQSSYPDVRMRRMRATPILRAMVRETALDPAGFCLPLFVKPGDGVKLPIASMPGQFQLGIGPLIETVAEAVAVGVRTFLLFGVPAEKDPEGRVALDDGGVIPRALRALRAEFGEQVCLITDECFCEYTSHGHCGVLTESRGRLDLDNDKTLPLLVEQCVLHARAGADVVAPSGMLDGMVRAIRRGLDGAGFAGVPILSYAAKYASSFYGPFRDAAESPPAFGDRSSSQMDPANSDEALREVALDIAEGADMVMVKPALAYLDIISRVKTTFNVPVAAYNVSGEYAMVKAAAQNGWIDERRVTLETLLGMRRAGASLVVTYHAVDAARWLA